MKTSPKKRIDIISKQKRHNKTKEKKTRKQFKNVN